MHGLEEALSGAWQEVQLLQVRNDELSDLRGDLEKELANANAQREAEKKRAETLEASSSSNEPRTVRKSGRLSAVTGAPDDRGSA